MVVVKVVVGGGSRDDPFHHHLEDIPGEGKPPTHLDAVSHSSINASTQAIDRTCHRRMIEIALPSLHPNGKQISRIFSRADPQQLRVGNGTNLVIVLLRSPSPSHNSLRNHHQPWDERPILVHLPSHPTTIDHHRNHLIFIHPSLHLIMFPALRLLLQTTCVIMENRSNPPPILPRNNKCHHLAILRPISSDLRLPLRISTTARNIVPIHLKIPRKTCWTYPHCEMYF